MGSFYVSQFEHATITDNFPLYYLTLNWKRTILNVNINAGLMKGEWFITLTITPFCICCLYHQHKIGLSCWKAIQKFSPSSNLITILICVVFSLPCLPGLHLLQLLRLGMVGVKEINKEGRSRKKMWAMKILTCLIKHCTLEIKTHFAKWNLVCFDASIISAHFSESVLWTKMLIIICLADWTTRRRIILHP